MRDLKIEPNTLYVEVVLIEEYPEDGPTGDVYTVYETLFHSQAVADNVWKIIIAANAVLRLMRMGFYDHDLSLRLCTYDNGRRRIWRSWCPTVWDFDKPRPPMQPKPPYEYLYSAMEVQEEASNAL